MPYAIIFQISTPQSTKAQLKLGNYLWNCQARYFYTIPAHLPGGHSGVKAQQQICWSVTFSCKSAL